MSCPVRIGAMKKLFLFLMLSSLVFSSAASAVEYKTYLPENPDAGITTIPLVSTDLIEIVSHGGKYTGNSLAYASLKFESGRSVGLSLGTKGSLGLNAVGYKFTGLTEISFSWNLQFITLKITNASEINKAGPTTVLVLPENATGNYNLVVESSTDSINWIPFHSGTVNSDTAERLFRVRIVHKGQEEAKAKAEEK